MIYVHVLEYRPTEAGSLKKQELPSVCPEHGKTKSGFSAGAGRPHNESKSKINECFSPFLEQLSSTRGFGADCSLRDVARTTMTATVVPSLGCIR